MEAWFEMLKKHVVGAWGEEGEQWLVELPNIVDQLTKKWNLKNIKPIEFPSYNYIAFCDQAPNNPVVLKISCDEKLIADEYKTHFYFNGHGAIRVFDYDDQLHAVLLERAVPGDVLRDLNRNEAIGIYADIVKKLQSCEQNNIESYRHANDWLNTIDRIKDERLTQYIPLAKKLISNLNNSPQPQKICHADLHLENIILHGDKYLAIDPKGVIGELAFEVSAFDLLTKNEIEDNIDLGSVIQRRIKQLSESLSCDYKRLLAWFYLRSLISAQWYIEDSGDPSVRLLLLSRLYNNLR